MSLERVILPHTYDIVSSTALVPRSFSHVWSVDSHVAVPEWCRLMMLPGPGPPPSIVISACHSQSQFRDTEPPTIVIDRLVYVHFFA
ncbi:unnamed protein product [Heligmosomoides polygyrus]|uniref:ZP domain-containing protein n=1 Tax=Heligmosomoides polygyrus TaxID=6339 RepID=A0A183G7C1_HELPZ|nr:unnamed protein product [Heligmosomoides polygyrus]